MKKLMLLLVTAMLFLAACGDKEETVEEKETEETQETENVEEVENDDVEEIDEENSNEVDSNETTEAVVEDEDDVDSDDGYEYTEEEITVEVPQEYKDALERAKHIEDEEDLEEPEIFDALVLEEFSVEAANFAVQNLDD